MSGSARATIDHDEIRNWVEQHGGHPSEVARTHGQRAGDPTGILRIDFPGFSGERTLKPISWDEFFTKFEDSELAFLYQDRTKSGRPSNFNKLVHRSTVDITAPSRVGKRETMRGQMRGQMKETRGRTSSGGGLMTLTDLLKQQHRMAFQLLDELCEGGRRARGRFGELVAILATHFEAEERVLYPVLKEVMEGEMLEAAEEHLSAKRILADLIDSEEGGPIFEAKLKVLRDQVHHHAEEEEQTILPKAESVLDRDQLVALAQEIVGTEADVFEEDVERAITDNTDEAASI